MSNEIKTACACGHQKKQHCNGECLVDGCECECFYPIETPNSPASLRALAEYHDQLGARQHDNPFRHQNLQRAALLRERAADMERDGQWPEPKLDPEDRDKRNDIAARMDADMEAQPQPKTTHCDECNPSFGCWAGDATCRNKVRPVLIRAGGPEQTAGKPTAEHRYCGGIITDASGAAVLLAESIDDNDGHLFASALDVRDETGLTPRQLVEKVASFDLLPETANAMADLICQQRAQLEDALAALRDTAELIEECDESALLACDADPHPPSSLSVLAERIRAILAKGGRNG